MSDVNFQGWPGNMWGQKCTVGTAGLSEHIATQGKALVGIFMPATWTAAAIGYQVSYDDARYIVLESNGTPVTTVADQDTFIAFPLPNAIFAPYIKIASVTVNTATPVTQGAARELILVFRDFVS